MPTSVRVSGSGSGSWREGEPASDDVYFPSESHHNPPPYALFVSVSVSLSRSITHTQLICLSVSVFLYVYNLHSLTLSSTDQ
jgi:hypothetical protein